MADNTLTLKIDNETVIPLLEKFGKDIVLPIIDGAGKSAYAIAVAHGYKGTESEWLESIRGEQGNAGKNAYEIAVAHGYKGTESEWLESISGERGNATNAAKLLKSKNIYLENTKVDTILTKLIEKLSENGYISEGSFRRLEYTQPRTGQDYIDLTGEPHFKISVDGGEKREFESDNMRVTIEPFGPKNIELKYYDLNDNEQTTLLIRGSTVAPDEVYTDTNGVIYTRSGNDIEINVSNYNDVDIFKILPNWNIGDINKITIKTSKRVMLKMNKISLHDKSGTIVNHSNSVWRVENPESTVFKWLDSYWTHLAIKDLTNDFGRDVSTGDSREPYFIYNAENHEYINSANEGL